ncbi:FAD/NAD(P)-binding domain-containing protein [Annulohypoxylon truncatum]|uniref:FAD/NAD(P)-binding domain-containing protein n=1 Tax=Annulohypoxylon truncatum TaxID=327061 RepID=UPI002007716C|nr:FAD/NAD(P)-binding domain-containing protein [Annulohypoxylon truncatum]KAI1211664.1 FAD/NAD(P)-binding domain-containing protein [Annulohypoxylon truncatum]
MDAYSVSFTSVSQRNFSRIWRDLKSCRQYSIMEMAVDDVSENPSLGQRIGERRARTSGRKPHVGVVGAGMSGLRCVDILLQHGFEVTLIEGRNRLGGRVHQSKLPSGHKVENIAGPNWIHGTNDNPILDLAKETKTVTGQWEERSAVFDEAGKQISASEAITHSTIMWDVVGAAFAYSNKYSATISPDESLWDFFQKEVPKRIPDTEENFERKRNFVYQLADQWGAFVGSHIFTQSLKFFWLEECIDGENLFVADTYEKILQLVAKPAIEGAKIKYGTIVNRIQSTNDEGGALKVYTEGGESLEFDEVVLTAPLGWLKRHTDAFEPALPLRLTKAIKSIGYGCLEKAYISFPKAFWTLDRSEDNRVEGFCQMLAPDYAADRNPKKWNQEFVELASLKSSAHPTLLYYFYGDQSKFITGELAKLPSKEKQDEFLYDWFKPYYSRLPNYDENSPDCQPNGCYATEWLNDELAGNGSYSNFQVGLEEGDTDIETMREGLPNRGLWLAGEHTAPFVALGTATGAYWSGESVGKRIAQAYSRGESGVMVLG